MAWEIEYTDQFGEWWDGLTVSQQDDFAVVVGLLEVHGPSLGYPYSTDIRSSRHGRMRELRVQSGGNPLRSFYAFDPRRMVILLVGGDKTGDDNFYRRYVPIADELYDRHLTELRREGLIP